MREHGGPPLVGEVLCLPVSLRLLQDCRPLIVRSSVNDMTSITNAMAVAPA